MAEGGGGAEYDEVFAQVRNVTWLALFLVALAANFMVAKPFA